MVALPHTLARTTALQKEEEACCKKMVILFTEATQTQRGKTETDRDQNRVELTPATLNV